MPQPLSDAMVATLRSDACAALAAILIIANAHGELMAWAQRTLSPLNVIGRDAAPNGAGGGGHENQSHGAKTLDAAPTTPAKLNTRRAPKLDVAAYQERRIAQRDADDGRLIEAMKRAPGASIREWGAALGKSRTAIVQGLRRLRDAGLIERDGGKWALAEASTNAQPQPASSAPPWIEPLSVNRVARHAADGRVRGELTMPA